MNEQVVQDIATCDPLDTDRLTVLQLRLSVISDFVSQLQWFMEEYDTVLEQTRQELDRQRERDEFEENYGAESQY